MQRKHNPPPIGGRRLGKCDFLKKNLCDEGRTEVFDVSSANPKHVLHGREALLCSGMSWRCIVAYLINLTVLPFADKITY